MSFNRSIVLSLALGLSVTSLVGCSKTESATAKETTTASKAQAPQQSDAEKQILAENTQPIDVQKNPAAIARIPPQYKFVNDGYLTVAVIAQNSPPLSALAADNKTYIGTEVDTARLVADSLGLKLKLVPTSWEDWPLGVSSGKYDAALINITVTKERKEKFDFATYRHDVLGFFSAKKSSVQKIENADDVAGLNVIVGAGTNQEKILLDWIEQNKKKGLKPAKSVYLQDNAAAVLALQSGRADVLLVPNSTGAWQIKNGAALKRVGSLAGGWPKTADIAVTLKKGTGLVDAVNVALNGVIQDGSLAKVLTRWGVQDEAVSYSEINPQGLGD